MKNENEVVFYLPPLRKDQWNIAKHPAKVKILSMGRRWGKTTFGGCISVASAYQGYKVAWVVPTYKPGLVLWRFIKNSLSPLIVANVVKTHEGNRTVDFKNSGGFIGIYSADNADAIRGDWFDIVIIDEAAMVKEYVWSDVIQPTLADVDGSAILISTPKGKNWFYYEWLYGKKSMNSDIASFQAPTSDNPIKTIKEAAEKAKNSPRITERTYRQEWLAEFMSDGSFFRNIANNLYIPDNDPQKHKGHKIGGGVDWAKKNDFTAISIICADCTKEIAIDRFNKIDYEYQKERLKLMYNKWFVNHILAESNAMGEPLIDSLSHQGLMINGFNTSSISKGQIISSLGLALEKEEIKWIKDDEWTMELESYEMEINRKTGRESFSAPPGMHDDTVMARALALKNVNSMATVMTAAQFLKGRQ